MNAVEEQIGAACAVVERLMLSWSAGARDSTARVVDALGGMRAELVAAQSRLWDDAERLAALERALRWLPNVSALVESSPGSASREDLRNTNRVLAGLATTIALAKESALSSALATQGQLARARGPSSSHHSGASEFSASLGVPAVHTLASPRRGGAGAPVMGAEDGDFDHEDDADDEVEPIPPEQRRAVRTRPMRERQFVERTLRHCLDEIAALYLLRRPDADKPWSHPAETEARLLRAFDAWGALAASRSGPSLDFVRLALDHALDAPTMDESRLFARALVLGSTRGIEPATDAVLATRAAPIEARDAECLGYCLASEPDVGRALRPLLGDDDPSLVRLALVALGFRRQIDPPSAVPLLSHPDPGVAVAAATALARVETSSMVTSALAELLTVEIDDAISLAGAESLRRHGRDEGVAFARARLIDDNEALGVLTEPMQLEYLRFLAIAGDPSDTEMLQEGIRGRAGAVSVLGWHGNPENVELLLGILATGNRFRMGSGQTFPWKLELAAAEALFRITGAPLLRAEHGASPPEDDGGGVHVSLLTDATDHPEHAMDVAEMNELVAAAGRLSIEAGVWSDWWTKNRGAFTAVRRYRFGRPYSAHASVVELLRPDTLPVQRRTAVRELRLAIPSTRLEPEDWIGRQRAELLDLERRTR